MDYSDLTFDWVGEITAIRGYGLQARRILRPLIEGGANVKLIQDEDYVPQDRRITDPWWLDQIEKSKAKPDSPVRICYSIPNLYKPNPKAINIGYTMWETDEYPREWVPLINQMNRFWVGTPSLVQSAIKAKVTVPIDTVSATIDLTEWSPTGPVSKVAEIPDGTVKFMFVGDWIPRKNYQDLVIAFGHAFSGVDDVALIIKTWSSSSNPEDRKQIERGVRFFMDKLKGLTRPKIYLLADMIEEKALINLMRGADVYTTASHGEGFDLPMCQAMALGKVVVATNYLAHADYMDETNSIPVKYTKRPVTFASAPMYDAYQMWSAPDMEDYINKLRIAYHVVKSKQAHLLGEKARSTVTNLFSPENNTPKIAQVIRKALGKDASSKGILELINSILP